MSSGAERVLAVGATLGEGPAWVAREQALWFVDIKAPAIHRFDPATGDHQVFAAPAQVGWVLPADDGAFLAGLQTGIARFDPATGGFDTHAVPPGHPAGNRLNDATVDAAGRIWFGTMDDAETADSGRVFVLDDGEVRDSGLTPVCITNGPSISPDGRTLYHTDTLGRVIHAVPLDERGHPGRPRVFATIDAADGWPDGSVVDAEGGVWTGLWGGSRVRRYDADGRIAGEVRVPVANVTKIAFGGPDLATAYATTARKGLDSDALAAQPWAGDLFAFDPGVRGQPLPLARIGAKEVKGE